MISKALLSLLITLAVIFGAIGVTEWVALKANDVTKQWTIIADRREDNYNRVYIRVVDTRGVCLYVTHQTLAAVPKTLLPPGTGCQ